MLPATARPSTVPVSDRVLTPRLLGSGDARRWKRCESQGEHDEINGGDGREPNITRYDVREDCWNDPDREGDRRAARRPRSPRDEDEREDGGGYEPAADVEKRTHQIESESRTKEEAVLTPTRMTTHARILPAPGAFTPPARDAQNARSPRLRPQTRSVRAFCSATRTGRVARDRQIGRYGDGAAGGNL